MTDKNGAEIRTGDVVRITGAYFKSDNGLYFVDHAPGDPAWAGTDLGLHRITKAGALCKTKSCGFWPIFVTVSSRAKGNEARRWNREHAQIELDTVKDYEAIALYFEGKAEEAEVWAERNAWDWGEDHPHVQQQKESARFYRGVTEAVRAKKEETK